MKTRNGFVSNSSSSSFVVIAPKAIVNEVLTSLTPYEQAVAKFVQLGDRKFMGQEVSLFQGSTGNNDSWEYAFEYEGEEGADDSTWEAWENFMAKLREKAGKDNVIISETDC